MLFQKGVTLDDTVEDDLYSMLVPTEPDQITGGKSSRRIGNFNVSISMKMTSQALRSPFQENMPFDNLYRFKAKKEESEIVLTCQHCSQEGSILTPDLEQMSRMNQQATNNIQKL